MGMDGELDVNSRKDKDVNLTEGWKHESCDNNYLIGKLVEEVAELIVAINPNVSRAEISTALYGYIAKLQDSLKTGRITEYNIRKEAFDTANLSLMLADNNGGL